MTNLLKQRQFHNPEVLQVKSVKLETSRASKDGKANAKSEDNLRKGRKSNILKSQLDYEDEANEGAAEVTSCLSSVPSITERLLLS